MSIILICGPCGVGKSTVGRALADRLGIPVVDLDSTEQEGRARYSLSSAVAELVDLNGNDFVLDVGGDTLFRPGSDRETQLRELDALRREGNRIVLLTCAGDELKRRYMAFPGTFECTFAGAYDKWRRTAEPNWRGVADVEIDTTGDPEYVTVQRVLDAL